MPPGTDRPLPGVLVADAEPLVQRMVGSLLSDRGYRVCEAPGATEALECLAQNANIAVLITDIELADGDGWSLAARHRGR